MVALLVLLAVALSSAARAQDRLDLEIRNLNRTDEIRCIVLLAHFFTLGAGTAAAGARLSLTFERLPAGSGLTLRNGAGRPMLVENLICGIVGDWSANRAEVPLDSLRAAGTASARADCVSQAKLQCRLSPPVE